ncbi:MAG: cytochrome c oxidase subunit II [Candidatus Dadabacteria bacterium]|nr:MAG: cytochrome c oxidase subunit II [Candidatus Dadabacteria bacterium]
MFRYLPEQASTFGEHIDKLNYLILDLSLFFTVAIFGTAVYFAIRYHRRSNSDKTPQIKGDNRLEVVWTAVPTVVVAILAYYGYAYHRELREPPPNSLNINVWAQQFAWSFDYPNGKHTSNELVVPVNEPVKLTLRSKDVLHSFFVPAMRVKQDAVPGQYTYLWFKPIKTGTYRVFCAEYCGTQHSAMLAQLKVVSKAEYERWLNDRSEELASKRLSGAKLGELLYKKQNCFTCHSLDGSKIVGPSFAGIWGKKEALEGGGTATVDENYIEESIKNPAAKIVKGYSNLMPSYKGQLTDQEIMGIISFIKSLKGMTQKAPAKKPTVKKGEASTKSSASTSQATSPEKRGEALAKANMCLGCHSTDGSKMVGPSFKGLYGRKGVLETGKAYTADENYIKRSIVNSKADIVKGYMPAMPDFKGKFSEQDLNDLISFIKSLK